MIRRPSAAVVERWLPRLDQALEGSVLVAFFVLPFPHTSRIKTVALTVAVVLWVVRTRVMGQPVRGTGLWFNYVLLWYLSVVVLGVVTSTDLVLSIKAVRGDLAKFLLAYVLVVETVRTPRQFYRLLGAVVLASTVIVGYALWSGIVGVGRLAAFYANPNSLGVALILPTTILWGLMLGIEKNLVRVVLLALLGIHVVVLLASGSRTAVSAVAIGMVVAPLTLSRWRRIVVVASVWLSIAAIVVASVQPNARVRFLSIFHAATYVTDNSGAGFLAREWIWRDTVDLIREHPWLGHGYGVNLFKPVFSSQKPQTVAKFGEAPHAHNLWLEVAFETGLLGLVSFVVVVSSVIVPLIKGIRSCRSREGRVRWAILAGGLVGVMIESMTEVTFGQGGFGSMFWGIVIGGTMTSLVSQRDELTDAPVVEFPPPPIQ